MKRTILLIKDKDGNHRFEAPGEDVRIKNSSALQEAEKSCNVFSKFSIH